MKNFIYTLCILLFLSGYSYADSQVIGGSWKGLNNGDTSILIGDDEAQDLQDVDLTDNAYGIKKRSGTIAFNNLTYTTSSVTGGYTFRDIDGDDTVIHAHDVIISKSVGGAAYSTFITTATNGSYWDFTDSQGYLWGVNSANDELWRYDGTSITYYPNHPRGNQIEAGPDRFIISGATAAANRLYFSAQADPTTFTIGTDKTSAFTDDVGLPGQSIQAIKWYLDSLLIWTKTNLSIWSGTNQFSADIQQVSPTLGTTQPNSIVIDNGQVYWQAQDAHFYAFDGNRISRLSQKISNSIINFANGEAKSWEQTSQTDFNAGTLSDLTSAMIPGDLVLSTWTATDTTSSDFSAGTFSNMDSTTTSGSVQLMTNNTDIQNNGFETGDFTNWTNSGSLLTVSNLLAKTGTYSSRWAMGPSSYTITILDITTATVTTSTFIPTVDSWTQKTLALTSAKGKNVRIKVDMVGRTLISDNFWCSGSPLTWYDHNNGGIFYLDLFEGGRSTIYDGTFISKAFNTQISSPAWLTGSITSGDQDNSLIFETRSSTDLTNWDSYQTWSNGAYPLSAKRQYIQYRVTASTRSTSQGLPYIHDVTLAARASTGTFVSQIKHVARVTTWGNLTADQTLNNGTINYAIRSATASAAVLTTAWTQVTNNTQIVTGTNNYFQVRADLSIAYSTQTPTLHNFTVNWNEGTISRTWGISDKDHRIMWAVGENGSTVPNATYIYDPRYDTWLKYSVPFVAPAKVGDFIYFGGASTGTVYIYPSGTTDNGTAITSFWKSKDFISSDPYIEKDYLNLNLIIKAYTGSNLDVTYTINTSSSISYNISLTDANSNLLIRNNYKLPNGKFGTFFNFKFGNDDADALFEVYTVRFDYKPRPWRVLP